MKWKGRERGGTDRQTDTARQTESEAEIARQRIAKQTRQTETERQRGRGTERQRGREAER